MNYIEMNKICEACRTCRIVNDKVPCRKCQDLGKWWVAAIETGDDKNG